MDHPVLTQLSSYATRTRQTQLDTHQSKLDPCSTRYYKLTDRSRCNADMDSVCKRATGKFACCVWTKDRCRLKKEFRKDVGTKAMPKSEGRSGFWHMVGAEREVQIDADCSVRVKRAAHQQNYPTAMVQVTKFGYLDVFYEDKQSLLDTFYLTGRTRVAHTNGSRIVDVYFGRESSLHITFGGSGDNWKRVEPHEQANIFVKELRKVQNFLRAWLHESEDTILRSLRSDLSEPIVAHEQRIGNTFKNPIVWDGFRGPSLVDQTKLLLPAKVSGMFKRAEKDPHKEDRPDIAGNKLLFNEQRTEDVQVTWLGHSTLLIRMNGMTILTDPLLTGEVWRMFGGLEPRIKASSLPEIDFVVISHSHVDHFHPESLAMLIERQQVRRLRFVVPLGLLDWFGKKYPKLVAQNDVLELGWGDHTQLFQSTRGNVTQTAPPQLGVQFVSLPMQHWSLMGKNPFSRNKVLWSGWMIRGYRGDSRTSGSPAYQQDVEHKPGQLLFCAWSETDWFMCKVKTRHGDGTYTVALVEKEAEVKRLSANEVVPCRFQTGQKVYARSNEGKWHQGRVAKIDIDPENQFMNDVYRVEFFSNTLSPTSLTAFELLPSEKDLVVEHLPDTLDGEIECESVNSAKTNCTIGLEGVGLATKVTMIREYSWFSKCREGETFGVIPNTDAIFVTAGCRGMFHVVYTHVDSVQDVEDVVECESVDMKTETCSGTDSSLVATAVRMQKGGQYSYFDKCGEQTPPRHFQIVPGTNQIKVSQGCRGKFMVTFTKDKPVTVEKPCESKGYKRSECSLPEEGKHTLFAQDVEVVQDDTGKKRLCRLKGRHFGVAHGRNAFWVDHGCRGKFKVTYGLKMPAPSIDVRPLIDKRSSGRWEFNVLMECRSQNYANKTCELEKSLRGKLGHIVQVDVVQELTLPDELCFERDSFGFAEGSDRIWVNGGCQGLFAARFQPRTDSISLNIACGDTKEGTHQCGPPDAVKAIGFANTVVLVQDDSGGKCVAEAFDVVPGTWKIFTTGGCKGVFEVVYKQSPPADKVDPYSPGVSKKVTLQCGDGSQRRTTCRVANAVGLLRRISLSYERSWGSLCKRGSTFGIDQERVWVAGGCYGDFDVYLQLKGPLVGHEVECQDWNGSGPKTYCSGRLGAIVAVDLVSEFSWGSKCTGNYGIDAATNRIYTQHGCRGNFRVSEYQAPAAVFLQEAEQSAATALAFPQRTPVKLASHRLTTLLQRRQNERGPEIGWEKSMNSVAFFGDTGYGRFVQELGMAYGDEVLLAALPLGSYYPRRYFRPWKASPHDVVQMHQELNAQHTMVHGLMTIPQSSDVWMKQPVRDLMKASKQDGLVAMLPDVDDPFKPPQQSKVQSVDEAHVVLPTHGYSYRFTGPKYAAPTGYWWEL